MATTQAPIGDEQPIRDPIKYNEVIVTKNKTVSVGITTANHNGNLHISGTINTGEVTVNGYGNVSYEQFKDVTTRFNEEWITAQTTTM